MSFQSARQDEIGKVGSGEIVGNVGVVSTYTDFEEGLKGGLFAKYNAGVVEFVDGEADSIMAGVVKRDITGALEDDGLYKATNSNIVDVIESGIVTVDVVAGLDVKKFDPVYVYNGATTEDQGKATNDATDAILVDGYFYKEVNTDVWAVRLK